MTTGTLTPLQLNAGASLLQNQGLGVSDELIAAIDAYEGTPLISAFLQALAAEPSIATLGASSVPAFSNSLPAAYASLGTQMTNAIYAQAYLDSGSGDIGKFAQALGFALAYNSSTNLFINSAVNSQTYLAGTFTSTNDMITGDVTKINLSTPTFGDDSVKLGGLIDLNNFETLGNPLTLIQRIVQLTGNVPVLSLLLLAEGIDEEIVLNLTNPTLSVSDSVQRLMYLAMTKVTGAELAQILKVLKITTPGISNMADLLNPVKIFPNSFQSFTVPTSAGLRAIYVNSTGSVNTALETLLPEYVITAYNRLKQIIPADQALANKALAVSLGQINGLSFTSFPSFGNTVKNLETTQSLPIVTALTQAVPSGVAGFYNSTLAEGTGVNGNVRLVDILGLAGGWIATPNFLKTVEIFNTMNLSALTTIYQQMAAAANGDYGPIDSGPLVIPSGPAAGTYNGTEVDPGPPPEYDPTALEVAFPFLIAAAQAEIANLQAAYPDQTGELNDLWDEMAEQIQREKDFQTLIKLNWSDLTPNDRVAIYGLIYSLPEYGLQTEEGGVAWLLEKMANMSTLGGESVIGCMREGRNQDLLNGIGIYSNTKIPGSPNPPPTQAELLPSTVSETEAIDLVVK